MNSLCTVNLTMHHKIAWDSDSSLPAHWLLSTSSLMRWTNGQLMVAQVLHTASVLRDPPSWSDEGPEWSHLDLGYDKHQKGGGGDFRIGVLAYKNALWDPQCLVVAVVLWPPEEKRVFQWGHPSVAIWTEEVTVSSFKAHFKESSLKWVSLWSELFLWCSLSSTLSFVLPLHTASRFCWYLCPDSQCLVQANLAHFTSCFTQTNVVPAVNISWGLCGMEPGPQRLSSGSCPHMYVPS